MKIQFLIAFCAFALYSELSTAQSSYKNDPLIIAGKENADIGIGKEWYSNRWRISPEIANDTLKVQLYSAAEKVVFKTDKDSIGFSFKPGEIKSFYVKMGNAVPAHTLIAATYFKWDIISYSKAASLKDVKLWYEKASHTYFDSLRRLYPTDEVIKNDHTDMEKVLSILNWTHHQWEHDGTKTPKGNSGLAILNEVKAGGRFPCFAYAIVLRDQLTAYGYKARVLYLKTKDAETRKSSPGHVVTEVFLNDQHKWVFVDGQFNVMPTLKGKPLNAVEFQHALSHNYDQLILASKDEVYKRDYVDFVYDYLYYYNTAFDNRILPEDKKFVINGKNSLMLVPVGAPNLKKISFFNSTIDNCIYTHSLNDFYAVPK